MLNILDNIWAVYLDTAFWLLLGLLAAGIVKAYIPEHAMQRWLGGRGLSAVGRAALFGAPLPLCSCGVLPAALSIRRNGASKEATISFLISTPETSIDSVAVTYALMGPLLAVYRPIAALVSAVVTGLMTALVEDEKVVPVAPAPATTTTGCCGEQPAAASRCCSSAAPVEADSCCASTPVATTAPRWLRALRFAGAELIDDISRWMLVGILVAGIMLSFIPPGWLAQWGQGLPAMLVMLLVGVPLYICAVASTPIAAGLILAGVSPGTVLVFLLVGPATNIASLVLVRRELGNKVTVIYLLGISVVSVLMGLLLDWIIMRYQLAVSVTIGDVHGIVPSIISWICAVLLLLLAITPLRRRLFPVLNA